MFSFKLLIAAAALVCVSARYIVLEDETRYYLLPIEDLEDPEGGELVPARTGRMRRQIQGSVTGSSDGTSGAKLQIPLAGGDKNILSAIGGVDLNDQHKISQSTVGLNLDNVNGHSLSLTKSQLPGADRLTAAANVNLFKNANHNLDAQAYAERTIPESSQFNKYNTFGAGADYMYKNKVGAEVNVAHTPLFHQTDYSAAGKLNLFRGNDMSLDFKAGLSKSGMSSWEPMSKFSFTKWF